MLFSFGPRGVQIQWSGHDNFTWHQGLLQVLVRSMCGGNFKKGGQLRAQSGTRNDKRPSNKVNIQTFLNFKGINDVKC